MKKVLPIILVVVLLLGVFGMTYNRLAALDENADQAWAQVENVLKRRADLIPNLVETVRGYAGHEEKVLTKVIEARSALGQAQTPEEYAKANDEMTEALRSINVVVEAYPELKADGSFINLQTELAGTENRIAVERKRYNDAVGKYNQAVRRFPSNLIAGVMGFEKRAYFEVSEADQKVPEVKF